MPAITFRISSALYRSVGRRPPFLSACVVMSVRFRYGIESLEVVVRPDFSKFDVLSVDERWTRCVFFVFSVYRS